MIGTWVLRVPAELATKLVAVLGMAPSAARAA